MIWIESIQIMNVIDSNNLERDTGGKPLHTFPYPALESSTISLKRRKLYFPICRAFLTRTGVRFARKRSRGRKFRSKTIPRLLAKAIGQGYWPRLLAKAIGFRRRFNPAIMQNIGDGPRQFAGAGRMSRAVASR